MSDYLDITPPALQAQLVVKLYQDDDPASPTENDNAGQLCILDRDFGLGDTDRLPYEPNRGSWQCENEYLIRFAERCIALEGGVSIPVRYSDYGSSGARIYTTDTDNANGLIWSDAAEIAKEWPDRTAGRIDGYVGGKAGARTYLEARIAELNQYLEGDVYGYVIEAKETGEGMDSCWGFYGQDYAKEEALSAAQHCAAEIDKRADTLAAARAWTFTQIFGALI